MTDLASLALGPWTVRSLLDEGALAGIRHTPPLPAFGPGRGFRPATGPVGFARALGVTVRGLNECTLFRLAVARPGVTGLGHTGPTTGHMTVDTSHVTVRPFLMTFRGLGREVGGQGGVAGIVWRF